MKSIDFETRKQSILKRASDAQIMLSSSLNEYKMMEVMEKSSISNRAMMKIALGLIIIVLCMCVVSVIFDAFYPDLLNAKLISTNR